MKVLVVDSDTGEDMDLDAFATATPGLVVLWHPIDQVWSITHQVSGLAISRHDSPEHAMFVAEQLGPVADWTRTGADLAADRLLRLCVTRVTLQSPGRVTNAAVRERALQRGATS